MDVMLIGVIAVVATVVLLLVGMPIGFIFLIIGFGGLAMLRGLDPALSMIGNRPFDVNSTYELSVVPLFVLMGHLAYASGVTQDIYRTARLWLGHLRGGLVIATTFANAAFGACCGSTTAATAVFGRVAIPEMLRYGVDRRLAAGCVAAAGSLSAIIPPSVLIIVYGFLARESIARLLIAGIIPGVITAVVFAGMVFVRATINPKLAPPIPRASRRERIRSLRGVWGVAVLAVVVLGGIFMGIFTPTEGGGIGAMGAFIIVLASRKLTRNVLSESFLETARTTAVIFIIITGALIFTMFLVLTGVPAAISTFIIGLPVPPVVIIIGFMLLFIALGCIVEPMSMMFLTIPIILPIVKEMGYDPVWFGILVVTTAEIGMVTPPMGLNCFMLKSVVPELPLRDIFVGTGWFIVMFMVALGLFIAFPQLVLWLPNLMFQ